jgi:two-component system NtrC family sensor kinase
VNAVSESVRKWEKRKVKTIGQAMITDEFFEGLDELDTIAKTSAGNKSDAAPLWNERIWLIRIVQDLTTNLDVDSLLYSVMDYAIEITKAERGFLALVNADGDLDFRVARGIEKQEIINTEKSASQSILKKVIESRKPIQENHVPNSKDLSSRYSLTQLEIKSVMGAPLISKDDLIGVIYVNTSSISNIFTKEDLVNLETFVSLAAIAIENARLFQNLTQTTQNYKLLKEYHENILKSLPMGIVVVEPDRTMEYMNEYAADMWNLTPGEGVGKKLETVFPKKGGSREAILRLWEKYLEDRIAEEGEITLDGNSYRVSFFDVLRWGRQDVRSGMLLLDISLRKQLEMELVNTEKQATIVQLAGGIAHEVNNLLTPILGRAAMAQMRIEKAKEDTPIEIGNDLAIIDDQAQKIKRVVENLNRLSRPTKPEMEKTCVGKCLATAVDVLSSTAGRIKRFDTEDPNETYYIKLEVEPELPPVKGNPQHIEQMFLNLIINAAHAVEDKGGGKIILKAFQQDDRVIATISDTGTGIAPEVLKHVFEPYFTTKGAGRGTGLGMPIVRQIADMHKATLDLDTVYGEGTTVTITFPKLQEARK